MEYTIEYRKAADSEYTQILELAKKYSYNNLLNKEGGFVINPLEEKYLKDTYVAIQEGKVLGMVSVRELSDADYDFFDVSRNEICRMIDKLVVEEDYRGQGIASNLLQYVVGKYLNNTLYAGVMCSPYKHDKAAFVCQNIGFEKYFEKELQNAEIGQLVSWALLKKQKNNWESKNE